MALAASSVEVFRPWREAHFAFSEGKKELYVTVVKDAKDPKDPQAKGSIVKIANVK